MTTAEMFADAMNARRVVYQQANDEQHAENLLNLLRLTIGDITARYAVGAQTIGTEDDITFIRFVDQSIAGVNRQGRTTADWEQAA